MSSATAPLSLIGIRRTFVQGERRLDVLRGVSLELKAGEIVALVGQSGSGKSTLLHIAGLLERSDEGDVLVEGRSVRPQSDSERTALRRKFLGFVYQYHHLLPEFSALENVILPQMIAGRTRQAAAPRAADLLKQVGLGERLDHRPAKLSGGEQQRVAIARALANKPAIILADEPTGNLDMHTADDVFDLLMSLVRNTGVAAMIATHNLELAKKMDRVITIREGVLQPY